VAASPSCRAVNTRRPSSRFSAQEARPLPARKAQPWPQAVRGSSCRREARSTQPPARCSAGARWPGLRAAWVADLKPPLPSWPSPAATVLAAPPRFPACGSAQACQVVVGAVHAPRPASVPVSEENEQADVEPSNLCFAANDPALERSAASLLPSVFSAADGCAAEIAHDIRGCNA